jgi:cysteine desulfurase
MTETTIYLDHAATTPVRPEVRSAMEPFLWERVGNASSAHAAGRSARAALESSRERVADALGAERAEIVFTGGGTEADNLAILGRWRAHGGVVAVSAIEHSAVLEAAAQAAREGAAVATLAVDGGGLLDLGALEEALAERLAVVSVMWGNNEVGAVQPVAAVGRLCGEHDVVFHTDAVQAIGHVPVSVRAAGCHLLTLTAHKFGGPQGVGVLYVRRGTELAPLLRGGGQEGGLRAGTANVAGAVGLAEALERATAAQPTEAPRLAALRDRLQARLARDVEGLVIHGPPGPRLPHILNVGLAGVEPDVLLPALDLAGLAVSSGSACHTGSAGPSHVLVAMGARPDAAIRFSLGWSTREPEVEAAAAIFAEVVGRVRAAGGAG